jgi:predicted flap endonuclease-1-like 5' DNA nuclease
MKHMTDTYYLDLSLVPLAQFKQRLGKQDLLPSRQILQEELNGRFETLVGMGIGDMQALYEALKTKKRMSQFAQESGLPLDYLTILRREVNSYRPKPVNLKAFPGVGEDCAAELAEAGIKNSYHLFSQMRTAEQQKMLADQTGIAPETLRELLALSDLVRINGVGPVFARMLYDLDVKGAANLAAAQAAPLFSALMALNQEKSYTKASFTEKDVAYCIEVAQMLS